MYLNLLGCMLHKLNLNGLQAYTIEHQTAKCMFFFFFFFSEVFTNYKHQHYGCLCAVVSGVETVTGKLLLHLVPVLVLWRF